MKKFLIFLSIAVVAAGAWFRLRSPAADEATEAAPVAKVETAPIKHQAITQTLDLFGIIGAAPSGDQVIAAPFDCVIRAVHATTGAHIAAGDLLLEIGPSPDAELQLESARSALTLAAKGLAATQERYELKLANSQDLLTAQQAEQDARSKMASFEKRGLGGDGKIVAANTGLVSKLELSTGSLVPGGTALITITTDEQLEARLGIEADDVAQARPGQTATLVSINRPKAEPVKSIVRIVTASIDPAGGSAEVRVPVPAGSFLMPGEHVIGSIELQSKEALVVPRSAVLPEEMHQVIFTVKEGKASRHEIQIGITSGDLVEISGANLNTGDQVVTLGNYELTDGMAVETGVPAPKAADEKETTSGKEGAKP
jgi:RND family efflux transporter MFP subunit